jgi:putative ABC transport system ATP-binding protein
MVTHDQKAADFATHELHLDKGVLVEQVSNAA